MRMLLSSEVLAYHSEVHPALKIVLCPLGPLVKPYSTQGLLHILEMNSIISFYVDFYHIAISPGKETTGVLLESTLV